MPVLQLWHRCGGAREPHLPHQQQRHRHALDRRQQQLHPDGELQRGVAEELYVARPGGLVCRRQHQAAAAVAGGRSQQRLCDCERQHCGAPPPAAARLTVHRCAGEALQQVQHCGGCRLRHAACRRRQPKDCRQQQAHNRVARHVLLVVVLRLRRLDA